VILVWITSAWYGFRWWGQNSDHISILRGTVMMGREHQPSDVVWGITRVRARLFWSYWAFDSTPPNWGLYFPIWILSLPLLLISATAWRLDTLARRRARVGLCPKCNYNLCGLPPDSLCPECGHAVG
jgi:hypothetical protein